MTAGNGKKRRRKTLDRMNLRRDVAKASQQYKTILDLCAERLRGDTGSFQKDEVLVAAELEAMVKAIRWDYVVDFLTDPEDVYGFSLVAVAQSFFDDAVWKKAEAEFKDDPVIAGRYTATGHAKRTAGYTLAVLQGGHLLLYRMQVSEAQRKGKSKAIITKIARNINDPKLDSDVKDGLTAISGIEGPKAIH
jgi:hypothetical protein